MVVAVGVGVEAPADAPEVVPTGVVMAGVVVAGLVVLTAGVVALPPTLV